MRFKTIVSSLALVGLASHALAQTAPTDQRVTITGSSIKRIASEGALPLQVISRAELDREGITNAEQVIMMLSTNGNGDRFGMTIFEAGEVGGPGMSGCPVAGNAAIAILSPN